MSPKQALRSIDGADFDRGFYRDRQKPSRDNPDDAHKALSWYCVYSNINLESRAEAGLKAKGFGVYLPYEEKQIVHARKISLVKRPLFPRYLFVAFSVTNDPWKEISRTHGVDRLLCNGDIPSPVPAGFVEALQVSEQIGAFKPIGPDGLNPGDFVEIIAGPFSSFIAEVKSAPDSKSRVDILVNLFGRHNKLKISVADLRRTVNR